ncbi:MAG: branched-chain amino acid transport system II carrier protein [Sterolibacterium sp.]|nr:branched-chain amino acid transport system II carrier protein [Sterolibacterium sp.]
MKKLRLSDTLALGLMTFALFLGAGNIIFPPFVGLQAGPHFWPAATGFLLTGVGLPLFTIIALARVGGSLQALTAPIGKLAGTLFGVAVYLCIGPFFATPRTATVSFEMGVAPFVGNAASHLFVFSLLYFGLVIFLALKPGRLINTIGKIITPILILSLLILAAAAYGWPAGNIAVASGAYLVHPLGEGFLQGYQTMDALGALVFGIVIVKTIDSQGVNASRLHTRYTIIAGLIAALCLTLVYLSLIHLGAHSASLAADAQNGAIILTRYVEYRFGSAGLLLLAVIILLACLTTAVGLVSACGSYFSTLLPLSYRSVVFIVGLFSMAAANQGLTQLIQVAVPALVTLYPLAITLVTLSLLSGLWRQPRRVFIPVMLVALFCGLLDGLQALGWNSHLPGWLQRLPGASAGLGWLLPVGLSLLLAAGYDRRRGKAGR